MLHEHRQQNSRESAPTMEDKSVLRSYCKSDFLTEDGLRQIIEHIGLTQDNYEYYNYHFDDDGFVHEACYNERVTEGIIRYLLEIFPDVASEFDGAGWMPLHCACHNNSVTVNIIELLIDASPGTVRSATREGWMPLHILCANKNLDEKAAIEILKLLIKKCPEAVRHADEEGKLPIHHASMWKSPEFCRVLIEAYPESLQISDGNGELPLHLACAHWAFPTAKCVYNLFPDAIHQTTPEGFHPIHTAIMGKSTNHEDTAMAAVEIVKYLLDCDPTVKLLVFQQQSLLSFAFENDYQNIEAAIQMIKAICDAHPEAIEENGIMSDAEGYDQQVQEFLNNQLFYAHQAKDHRLMTTPDNNGHLPLHRALQNNASFGSIKLLVKGNPAALQSADNSGSLPLHVACQRHDSVSVIRYLVRLDRSTLDAVDGEGNAALHLACRNARHGIIALFLEKYGAVSVSTRNADKKLPIELLWESVPVEDRESIGYIENVYRLLRANPGMMMGIGAQTLRSPASTSSTLPCQTGKKRKFGQ